MVMASFRKQVSAGMTVALLGMASMGVVGCRQAVQYKSTADSAQAASKPQDAQNSSQAYLEVNYGAAGKDKRGMHSISSDGTQFELDTPLVLPSTAPGLVSFSVKSGALAGLGSHLNASVAFKSEIADALDETVTSSSPTWAVGSRFIQDFRDQMKASRGESGSDSMTLTMEGDQGTEVTVLIPVRNPPEAPSINFSPRQLSANQAVQLTNGTWVLAVGDLKVENSSDAELSLHLSRKVSGNLLKGYTRTTLSQGDCAIQPNTSSWLSSLSSEMIVLSAGEPVSALTGLAGQEAQSKIEQKLRSGASWKGTVYAIRQESFGNSFQPGQCFVGPAKMLVSSCSTGGCKRVDVIVPGLGKNPTEIQCDQNGNEVGFLGKCPVEGDPEYLSVSCIEHWVNPSPPIPASDTINILGMGLNLPAGALVGQVTYSDIPFESPHQATDEVLSGSQRSLVGNVPMDALMGDFPQECPLN
jgi:hypothetical protein